MEHVEKKKSVKKIIGTKVGIALVISVLLLIPNFLPYHLVKLNPASEKASWDQFNPDFVQRFRTVSDILHYVDSLTERMGTAADTVKYAETLGKVLRDRFYHGYSYYSLKENWIAAVSGALVYRDLAAIVLPDDILKYPQAACSQISIVRIECFRRRRINYRKVAFRGHFALEAAIAGQWRFYDSNLEPDFSEVPRNSIRYLIDNNELEIIYKGHIDSAQLNEELAFIGYGAINDVAAPRARLFHIVTKFLSKTLWVVPLFWLFLSYRRKKLRAS